MQINQHNYETFFLMYVDQELSQDQKEQVEAFVRQHPALAKELELLKQTLSPVDKSVLFNDKANLMKAPPFTEEELFTYLDGEADEKIEQAIKARLADDPSLQHQIAGLEKLYLPLGESLSYTRKNQLYKSVPVRRLDWRKWVAAASLIVFISTWFFLYKEEEDVVVPIVQNDTAVQPSKATPEKENNIALSKNVAADTLKIASPAAPHQKPGRPPKKDMEPIVEEMREIKAAPAAQPEIAHQTVSAVSQVKDLPDVGAVEQEIVEEAAVPEVRPVAPSDIPVAYEGKEKRPSFLRKIGRKIENRALNILTNGGDEIQVAGFKIQLED
ncbi:hypothetical protein ABDK00_002700 [Niabella insulamsoli]|uniref:anti-sigma factor family protein n=1 Tax=Niabella insulamsoli TaxID=3144874 RepID=UPI0031FBB790